VIAVHEAGHALLAMLIEKATPPERISIHADMQGALGYVLRAARARPYAITAEEMRADVCVGLGGYSAEREVFGDVSIGAWQDLQQANDIARAMVEEFGMSKELGVRVVVARQGVVSEERKARIDQAIAAILEAELARAESIIRVHRHLLDAMVATLLEKKVIDRAQIEGLMHG
jgi:cell division protease FtsH